ncbi:flagellar hook-basal body complex protein [Bythopirellula polymerisocia]|uniref:Flagellar hook protein FlgE n=1 Tax=Bythopirellula polymerisocia TaxID=2528003 RepID=A0A5C6CXP1_9BACT|nr:flagellar hook-basal body complex protein [Bythopirellula polymerisocia]TWU27806.1 Flagellar hook protein FlgE [Bythopirellula polymerisocia]
MGLQSALSTALTGLTAAETSIDVVGNNVANSQTVGFKESSVNFATQFLQTQSIGSAPTTGRGGTNPRQIGLGVKVAEITPKFTQGTVEISSSPLDLAIQGDGFYIVEGSGGSQLYTRNGQFKTNANNEIVTSTGQRVLGFGVDSNFEIQPTVLKPISIPLGAAAVAQPTENVFLEGSLDPSSEVGSVPGIIQSDVLSDGTKEVPANTSSAGALSKPNETTTLSATLGGSIGNGNYRYRVTFVDGDGNEGPPSNVTSTINLSAGGTGQIDLSSIPQPAGTSEFTDIRIYRDLNGDDDFRFVDSVSAGTTSYSDITDTGSLGASLVSGGLNNGSYSYYVTYYNSTSGTETRPSARFGPVSADATTSPYIRLDNIPSPTNDPNSGSFDGVRIYRNQANSQNEFRLVGEINPTQVATFAPDNISFMDSSPDSAIASAPQINLDGPEISFALPLIEVISRDGSNYTNLFKEGVLDFTGAKGGRDLATKQFTITSTTTVGDLITFMEQSMGVLKTANEDSFDGSINYGGTIQDSRLQFTSNLGIQNALDINLSAFQLTDLTGSKSSLPLDFTSTNSDSTPVNGEGGSAEFIVYDSLGIPLSVRVTTVLERKTSNGAEFRYIATSPDNEPETGNSTVVGTGVIKTDGNGNIVSVTEDSVAIDRRQSPSASPLLFQLDFSQVTGLSTGANELSASRQDGFAAGTLSSFIITETGLIQGVFSNGSARDLGQLRMARFANNGGLEQVGDNMFAAGVNSGLPIQGDPGANGLGNITAGAVELSNTDIGQNLIELILASTQYRGGARVITAVQQLLDELLALRR